MAITERLALIIDADGKGAVRELQKVGDTAAREMGKAESSLDGFGKSMTSAGTSMMAGAAVIGVGMWKAGEAAAGLEQAVGGTEAVFGQFGGTVDEFAKGAATAAGLTEQSAREMTSSMGAILQGFGFTQDEAAKTSVSLAQLGADLSATFGGAPEEAVQALGAALRGEYDPLERFGVSLSVAKVESYAMSEGMIEAGQKMDSLTKAQATLALITEQSAMAQGQFARETDTTAGRLAIAKAEFGNATAQLGQGFLPVMTKVAGGASAATAAFTGLDSATGGMISTMAGLSVPILGAGGAIAFTVGKAIEMRETFKGLADSGSKVGNFIKNNSAALTGVGVVLGAAAMAWQMYEAEQQKARQEAEVMLGILDKQTGALGENAEATLLADFQAKNQTDDLERAGVTMRDVTSAIEDNTGISRANLNVMVEQGATREQIAAKLREEGGARNELLAKLFEEGEANRGLVGTLYDKFDAYGTAVEQQEAANEVTDDSITKTDRFAAAIGSLPGPMLEVADLHAETTEKYEDATKELDKYIKKIDEYFGGIQSATQLEADWHASIDSLTATVTENGLQWDWMADRLDITTEAGRENQAMLEASADAAQAQGTAVMNSTHDVKAAAKASLDYAANLRGQLQALHYNNDQIDIMFRSVGLMPDQINMAFNQPGMAEAISNTQMLNFLLSNIPRNVSTSVTSAVTGVFDAFKPPRRAAGGPVGPGLGATLVGEEGPELVVFGQSGTVVPARETAAAMAGGNGGGGPASFTGDVYLDATKVGKIVGQQLERDKRGRQGWGGVGS